MSFWKSIISKSGDDSSKRVSGLFIIGATMILAYICVFLHYKFAVKVISSPKDVMVVTHPFIIPEGLLNGFLATGVAVLLGTLLEFLKGKQNSNVVTTTESNTQKKTETTTSNDDNETPTP